LVSREPGSRPAEKGNKERFDRVASLPTLAIYALLIYSIEEGHGAPKYGGKAYRVFVNGRA
jgi:hypothetical protein